MMANHRRWLLALALLTAIPLAQGQSAASEFTETLGKRPDLLAGSRTFETCAACHGLGGEGLPDGTVPRLAGQHYRVLVKQLVDFRYARRWDYRMENFADRHHLPDSQAIANVAAYAAQLYAPLGGVGDGKQLAVGARTYFAKCQACHGTLGQGSDARLVPRLSGQQYEYLVRQLHDTAEERRPNMSSAHQRLTQGMSKAEIDGVSDYLSRSLAPRSVSDPRSSDSVP